jgi:hypothetical protein
MNVNTKSEMKEIASASPRNDTRESHSERSEESRLVRIISDFDIRMRIFK